MRIVKLIHAITMVFTITWSCISKADFHIHRKTSLWHPILVLPTKAFKQPGILSNLLQIYAFKGHTHGVGFAGRMNSVCSLCNGT